MSGRLEGRVAVVVGGGGFIGRAIAERFGQEGSTVVVADVDDSRRDEFMAGLAVQDPARVAFVRTNARSDADVRAMVATVLERHGRIDILVPLVGGSKDALLHKMTDEQWDEVIDLNLRSTFLACRAVVPHMIERGSGRIVLMSSRSFAGNIGQVNYSTAKAGIVGFTSSLAREMARHHVTVNCVVPGFIDNPRLATMAEKYRQMRIELNPFKEVGTPADVANAIVFLASDEAAQITGQALHVASW
jgi:NAD(P)-dependent dehydrogenase (short-subunit alcohol dehydrogenase family)